jgi:hypothetical protein
VGFEPTKLAQRICNPSHLTTLAPGLRSRVGNGVSHAVSAFTVAAGVTPVTTGLGIGIGRIVSVGVVTSRTLTADSRLTGARWAYLSVIFSVLCPNHC